MPAYSEERLRQIFERSNGKCHLCDRRVYFKNYNVHGARGAWQVEHWVPRAKGGTDHLNNLYPAHIRCNQEKGTVSSRTARGWNGRTRAPLSKSKRAAAVRSNTFAGGVIGGAFGLLGGPAGVVVGASLGALIGSSQDPDA